jgi:hypothetical protein
MSNLTEAQDSGADRRAFAACIYFVKFHKDVLKTLRNATTFYELFKIATPRRGSRWFKKGTKGVPRAPVAVVSSLAGMIWSALADGRKGIR